ncbi:MAG TPA: sigma-54 dependent transcriptional regulator [Myxococcota bacterium]|nr:sigma-54 dependent transcriptional regulator [Myxococcota bacterium]HQK49758.1 sigma-54 dependent transcriptional regulator [Myxococcota bacterium]
MERRVLIVEDEAISRNHLRLILQEEGYQVRAVPSAEEAIRHLTEEDVSCVLCDWRLPGMDGMELLGWVRRYHPETPVVIMTAYATIENAVSAMGQGAADYLAKPFGIEQVRLVLARVLERQDLQREVVRLRSEVSRRYSFDQILGRSPGMLKVFEVIRAVAETDATVLIQGETGVGKELVARSIHAHSLRKDGPFVAVNCGALAEALLETELFGHEKGAFTGAIRHREGRIDLAQRGTLFLDEVSEMSPAMQVRLLRVLQEGTYERVGGTETIRANVRVIAATNRDLRPLMATGAFREDLYYRLHVVPVEVPPLRERREDIPLLALHFLAEFRRQFGRSVDAFGREALDQMLAYSWPGNVRELRHVVERAVLLNQTTVIERLDLARGDRPPRGRQATDCPEPSGMPLREFLVEAERRYWRDLLDRQRGNVTAALKEAQVPSKTFYRRIRALGVDPRDHRSRDEPGTPKPE